MRSWSLSPDNGSECSAALRSLAISAAAALLSSNEPAGDDIFDGLLEFHALDVLDEVSAGAGQYCVQHRFVGGR